MKLYKDKYVTNAEKDQIDIMIKAGWSKENPAEKVAVAEEPIEESTEEVEDEIVEEKKEIKKNTKKIIKPITRK